MFGSEVTDCDSMVDRELRLAERALLLDGMLGGLRTIRRLVARVPVALLLFRDVLAISDVGSKSRL